MFNDTRITVEMGMSEFAEFQKYCEKKDEIFQRESADYQTFMQMCDLAIKSISIDMEQQVDPMKFTPKYRYRVSIVSEENVAKLLDIAKSHYLPF